MSWFISLLIDWLLLGHQLWLVELNLELVYASKLVNFFVLHKTEVKAPFIFSLEKKRIWSIIMCEQLCKFWSNYLQHKKIRKRNKRKLCAAKRYQTEITLVELLFGKLIPTYLMLFFFEQLSYAIIISISLSRNFEGLDYLSV